MNRIAWQALPHAELSLLLRQATLEDSRAVGTSTVYHLCADGREMLAISMADGQAVVVELAPLKKNNRRRIEPGAPPLAA